MSTGPLLPRLCSFMTLLLLSLTPVSSLGLTSVVGRGGRSLGRRGMVAASFDRMSRPSIGSQVLDPLIICGPSGVGKGSIIDVFMKQHNGSERFGFSVSHTSRQPRPGEEEGVHYHFVSQQDFETEDVSSRFIEWAQVHGNFYGTSWEALRSVQSRGKRALLDIDVQGVQRLKMMDSGRHNAGTLFLPRFIFIAPPSLDTLQERLTARGTESPESLRRRVANAKAEVDYGLEHGNFDAVIVNDDLLRAGKELADTIDRLYEI